MGIDKWVDETLTPVSNWFSSVVFFKVEIFGAQLPLIVFWLITAAVFFTFYLGFINLRGFATAIRLVRKGSKKKSSQPGEISHFAALCTAVSGTVGIGNIGGVALAISVGGPGAAFWLFVAGFLGMSTKFVECTLGVMYRRTNPDGSVSGGPMYYLQYGLGGHGWPRLGKALGVFYAIGIVIGCMGIGNMSQSNQAYAQLVGVTGGDAGWFADKGWLFGLCLAILVGLVIIHGIRSIARTAAFLVPFMAVLYIVACLFVLAFNYEAIPWAFGKVMEGAFSPEGMTGGMLGAMIVGFQRAVFSNEAGIGSASIAHSAVRTNTPVTEGFVSLLEPFLDTMVICMLTASVIITTEYFIPGVASRLEGIQITSAAFERVISWAPVVLSFAASLFAFSTILAWSYYGLKAWTYLVGDTKIADLGFKLVFCTFVMLGAMISLKSIFAFADAMVFVMALPNILGLYILAPQVKKAMRTYMAPGFKEAASAYLETPSSSPSPKEI